MKNRKAWLHDFRQPSNEETWYDLEFDALLIEQSIAKQYGVLPTAQGELPWSEWAKLVGGLMDDTPLGRVVTTRSETDRELIKQMGPWQRRVRAEWAAYRAKTRPARDQEADKRALRAMEATIARLFGGR